MSTVHGWLSRADYMLLFVFQNGSEEHIAMLSAIVIIIRKTTYNFK